MSETPADDRIAKYRRVLPCLSLEHRIYARGETIAVTVHPRITERCDIALRLVHMSGRTYAQRDVELGPETDRVVLRRATNLPDGIYELVATPPLAEFYATTPVEHRWSCRVLAEMAAEKLTTHRANVLSSYAHAGEGMLSRIARFAVGQDMSPTVLGHPLPPADALLLVLAEARLKGSACATRCYHESSVPRPDASLAVHALAYLCNPSKVGPVETALCHFGSCGFNLSAAGLEEDLVAIVALAECGDGDIAELATAVLDKLVFCVALGESSLVGAVESGDLQLLRSIRGFLFDHDNGAAQGRALLALALAGNYRLPQILVRIAAEAGTVRASQRHGRPRTAAGAPHIQSPYCTMNFGDTEMEVRLGNDALRLDFSLPHNPNRKASAAK